MNNTVINPFPDIIDDSTFEKLHQMKAFSENRIRDLNIRNEFKQHRQCMSAGEAIDKILDKYQYLQFDTVRKIVYKKEQFDEQQS